MKKTTLTLFAILLCIACFAQDITGDWNGVLKTQGVALRLIFRISKNDSAFSCILKSPDQSPKDIPASSTSFDNSSLHVTVSNLHIEYTGSLKNDSIVGNFKQNGLTIPLNLFRQMPVVEKPKRPQEPAKPYPYYSEDITFENQQAKITLAGTLTLPQKDGVFPAVVLISGSGPQNRDEELLGHKPFLVLADYLTKNGIAVLRFDDRGTAQSKGTFNGSTSQDFSTDVDAAVAFLQTRKEINKKKIGLIGHSEGALIAPMVAARSKNIAFIVLLAGPGIPCDQLLLLQQSAIAKASGKSDSSIQRLIATNKKAFEIVKNAASPEQLKTDMTKYLKEVTKNSPEKPQGMSDDDFVKLLVERVTDPWTVYFLKYDPAIALEKVKCPVLALNGDKDLQVTPKENLEGIKQSLAKGGNKKVTTKLLPNLNHLFQECKTGAPSEYATIEQTFSPAALSEVLQWIQTQVK